MDDTTAHGQNKNLAVLTGIINLFMDLDNWGHPQLEIGPQLEIFPDSVLWSGNYLFVIMSIIYVNS